MSNFQIDKFYKTRGGKKAKVVGSFRSTDWMANSETGKTPRLLGYVVNDDEDVPCTWDVLTGMVYKNNDQKDLVEEWKEPKSGFMYMNVFPPSFPVVGFTSRKEADEHDRNNERIACVRVEWKEGQFDD